MANPEAVKVAAAEVNNAQAELKSATKDYEKLSVDMYHAERRVDLANIRLEEANRVLLEAASE
ncbi:hypothetical protein PBI_SPORTO_45 [Arthrobacter phage Sporto]|nr:hypothetical protein PBI_SPORTO_45 [Arthrobacter phage Sporto]